VTVGNSHQSLQVPIQEPDIFPRVEAALAGSLPSKRFWYFDCSLFTVRKLLAAVSPDMAWLKPKAAAIPLLEAAVDEDSQTLCGAILAARRHDPCLHILGALR
jgi:hypothetical protein